VAKFGKDPIYRTHDSPVEGENPIYFGVIRSKAKVKVTIHIIFDNRAVSAR
jgi:hypothetical protein